jgi:hypothetical protein
MSTQTPDKPFVAHPLPPKPEEPRRAWMLISIAAVAMIVGLSLFLLFRSRSIDEPRLNESTVTLAKFVASRQFDGLPYDKQRQFYKVLEDRGKELDVEYANKRITEAAYRTALEAAWLGKHINQVEKYFQLPPGQQRSQYIDKLVTKKLKPKKEKTAKEIQEDEDEIKADETAAELRVESWPPAVRLQWQQFHSIYREEKKQREKAATKPAK